MRTNVVIKGNVQLSDIKDGDTGYIDGYVRGSDDRPYAAVVIPSKGVVDFVPLNQLKTTGIE